MTDTKHTPTPWKLFNGGNDKQPGIEAGDGSISIVVYGEDGEDSGVHGETDEQAKDNAAHIVKCVNMHDELVEALFEVMRKTNDVRTSVIASDVLKKAGAL